MVKKAFTEAANSLFGNLKKKDKIMSAIKGLQLSRSTVIRRFEVMEENLAAQLERDIDRCECFSLQFDESIVSVDIAQLCVFIRMMFENMTAKEELLCMLPLKEHTRGEDTFQAFMNFANKTKLPLVKLISITTDGAPAMVGSSNGFIALCKQNNSSKFYSLSLHHQSRNFIWESIEYERDNGHCHKNCFLNSSKEPAEKTFSRSLGRGRGRTHCSI